MFKIVVDDLSGDHTQSLLRLHLAGMRASSPPEHSFALDLTELKDPRVTVLSVRLGTEVVGIGALKELDSHSGEVKTMRTHPNFLRQGVATRLLDYIIDETRTRGWNRLSLETGTGPAFEPALVLYKRRGFVCGEAFANYIPSSFNQFLHLSL